MRNARRRVRYVAGEVQHLFTNHVGWLTSVVGEGQRTEEIQTDTAVAEIALGCMRILKGAMVVRRGMRSSAGLAVVGNTFLLSVLAGGAELKLSLMVGVFVAVRLADSLG